MNNAGFALMRYFRDLGADAWLIPFSNPEPHFAPEWDTWEWDKWRPFLRPPLFPNNAQAVLGSPKTLQSPPSKQRIRAALDGYDRFVGSGVTPALFHRIGRTLDIFFPYSMGIEYYDSGGFQGRMAASPIRRLLHRRVRALQARGIRSTRYCLNAELSLTRKSFEEIGKPFLRLGVPAIYNKEDASRIEPSARLREILDRMSRADLALFGAARQMWIRNPHISEADWPSHTKNSDWLIRGLAEFVRSRPQAKPLLVIVEYGPDVEATKRLVEELRIGEYVQWLPVLPRREIMLLLEASHIGVGEFYTSPGLLWGGTGWETLASGRPLLQAFNFTSASYEAEFGHAPPPILDAKSAADVSRQLSFIFDQADKGRSIGAPAAQWFDQHGGIGLAQRWLDLLGPPESESA
jgi:hypothetical protein